ncbi:MAG: L,D-transpeptidase family protein [Alphaproteobacteria bacterium]|jgi:murein L,D-transpeptidase YafK|nr:L,D-transpeptidase family protein [Alphaproteobacteria bacterium]
MHRVIAALVLLFLAACAGPPDGTLRAPGEGISDTRVGMRGPASREMPSGRGLVADYLLVDKSERLLIAYAGGRPIRAYRDLAFGDAPMGHKRFEGDERTPEGLYSIDWRNPNSRYHLSLRISYPNAEDRANAARLGRSPGGNIFIHGQPNGHAGPPVPGDWTDGCIALSNTQIEELWRLVPDGTPIEIRP